MNLSLIRDRRFGPFFWTQFLGAFNDNLLKFAVTLAVTYNPALRGDWSAGLLINLIAAVFILPFFLLSATSGQLADKYDKARIMRLAKVLEPPIALLTGIGFALQSVELLVFAVFLLGAQSALFGPAKYAYLPEQLKTTELVMGNALVESATFIAILLGTIMAGTLLSREATGVMIYVTCGFGIAIALAGVWTAFRIPNTPSHNSELRINWNLFSETWRNLQDVSSIKSVWPSLLGISWLWFVGATYLTQFPLLTQTLLHASPGVATFLLFTFTVGLGVGALCCERLSRHRVEPGLIVWGLVIMILGGLGLHALLHDLTKPVYPLDLASFLNSGFNGVLVFVFVVISMGVGLFSVPLYTGMQSLSPAGTRSRVVAANNIMNALLMVTSAGVAVAALTVFNGAVLWVFSTVTFLNVLVLAIWLYQQPHMVLRAVLFLGLPRKYAPLVENQSVLSQAGAYLFVFPTLLHPEYRQRLAALPVAYSLVLSGLLPSSAWVRWLRKRHFVFEFTKLTEVDAQRQLIRTIATEIQAGRSIAIDLAMFNLLTQHYKLGELPRILSNKGFTMHIVQVREEATTNQKGEPRTVLTLT